MYISDTKIHCRILLETYSIEDCFAYVTDFSDWDTVSNKGTEYSFSPFVAPTDNSIEFKFNNTTGTRVALGDKTTVNASGYLEWIYAWYFDTNRLYKRTSTNAETYDSLSYTKSTSSVYRITYSGTTYTIYRDDTVVKTGITYDVLSLTRYIRLNSNTLSNITYMKVKPLSV